MGSTKASLTSPAPVIPPSGGGIKISNMQTFSENLPALTVSANVYTVPAGKFAIVSLAAKSDPVTRKGCGVVIDPGVNDIPFILGPQGNNPVGNNTLEPLNSPMSVLSAGQTIAVKNFSNANPVWYSLNIIEFENS